MDMNLFFAAFCIIPPVLLGAKRVLKWRISSWWFLAGFIPVGWILVNLAIEGHFNELARLGDERATIDGAARVFGLLFGGVYAALYFGAWVSVYRVRALL